LSIHAGEVQSTEPQDREDVRSVDDEAVGRDGEDDVRRLDNDQRRQQGAWRTAYDPSWIRILAADPEDLGLRGRDDLPASTALGLLRPLRPPADLVPVHVLHEGVDVAGGGRAEVDVVPPVAFPSPPRFAK